MLKEIHEQPKAILNTLTGHISEESTHVMFDEIQWPIDLANNIDRIHIVVCCTS